MPDNNKTLLQHVMEDDAPWWKEALWRGLEVLWSGWVRTRQACRQLRVFLLGSHAAIFVVGGVVMFVGTDDVALDKAARKEMEQREALAKEKEAKRLEQESAASRKRRVADVRSRAKDNWANWHKTFGTRMNVQCYHGDNFATAAPPQYTITCHLGSKENGGPPTMEVVCTAGACSIKNL